MADQTQSAPTATSQTNTTPATVTLNPQTGVAPTAPAKGQASTTTEPTITSVQVTGEPDTSATGTAYYDTVTISLEGENLTKDNFLTKEGLHWSDKTTVELISGTETGVLNDASTFAAQNTPSTPVAAFAIEVGTKGRITHVGKTQSGLDLDLLWTITDTDSQDWKSHSGMGADARVKGIGFAGEQTIPGAVGNSIVVLYNEANRVGIHYQIVKRGTEEEVPVILSFITTDIDGAQGVKTDLANLAQLVTPDSDLAIDDAGIIYDASVGGPYGYGNSLNGSLHLPKGGYLGAGFVSHFDYTFYSPAPARLQDTYSYSPAVRYDIFGSSLQAKVETTIKQTITVQYQDSTGQTIQSNQTYEGTTTGSYLLTAPELTGYRYLSHKLTQESETKAVVTFTYAKDATLTFTYVDSAGKTLSPTKTITKSAGDKHTETAPAIAGYTSPSVYTGTISGDVNHVFVYQKVVSATPAPQAPVTSPTTPTPKPPVSTPTSPGTKPAVPTPTKPSAPSPSPLPVTTRPSWTSIVDVPPSPSAPPVVATQPAVYRQQVTANTNWTVAPAVGYTANRQPIRPVITQPTKKLVMPEHGVGLDAIKRNLEIKGSAKPFIDYILEVEKIAKKKHKNNLAAINRDIAQVLAYGVYHDDRLQNLFNEFKVPLSGKNREKAESIILNNHENAKKTDFAHTMTTLASIENQENSFKNIIKFISSRRSNTDLRGILLEGLVTNGLEKDHDRHTILQQNSLVGDIFTNMPMDDVYSDIDSIILARHPDFKDLPLGERILIYYSQSDLDTKRMDLFWSVYSENKTVARTKFFSEIISTTFTIGGIGLIIYGLKEHGYKKQKANVNVIDDIFFDGGFKAFMKNPIKVGTSYLGEMGKYAFDRVVDGVKSTMNAVNHYVVKPATSVVKSVAGAVNTYVVKPIANAANNYVIKPVTSMAKATGSAINNHVIKPITKAVNNYVVKPVTSAVNTISRAVNTHVIKPVASVAKKVVNFFTGGNKSQPKSKKKGKKK